MSGRNNVFTPITWLIYKSPHRDFCKAQFGISGLSAPSVPPCRFKLAVIFRSLITASLLRTYMYSTQTRFIHKRDKRRPAAPAAGALAVVEGSNQLPSSGRTSAHSQAATSSRNNQSQNSVVFCPTDQTKLCLGVNLFAQTF